MRKKAVVERELCVACGCCMTACRVGAITVPCGVYAVVNNAKCVGCGMCVKQCPASVITLSEVKEKERKID